MVVAEITRRRAVGERLQLDVQHGAGQYTVWIVPAKGMNHEVVGYRVWIGNATLLLGSEEQAVAAALNAVDKIRSPYSPHPDTQKVPVPSPNAGRGGAGTAESGSSPTPPLPALGEGRVPT